MFKEEVLEKTNFLLVPNGWVDLDREEMSYVDGGGGFTLTISCTLGGCVSGFYTGLVTGYVIGYVAGLGFKLGKYGGFIGSIIGTVIGGIAGSLVSKYVNQLIYNSNKTSITLINIPIWGRDRNYDIDLGESLADLDSIFGGAAGAVASASSLGFFKGFA